MIHMHERKPGIIGNHQLTEMSCSMNSQAACCVRAFHNDGGDENPTIKASREFQGRTHQLHLLRLRHLWRERTLCERGCEVHAGAASSRSQGRRRQAHRAGSQRSPIVLFVHLLGRQEIPSLLQLRYSIPPCRAFQKTILTATPQAEPRELITRVPWQRR